MNILVTKINYLGDAVSFLPTLKGISEHFPEVELTLVCTPPGRHVFEGISRGLDFFTVDYDYARSARCIWRLLQASAAFRNKAFSVSIHSYDEPSFSYILSSTLGVKRRIGFSNTIAKANKLLSEKIPFDTLRNVVDLNFDLVRHLTGNWKLAPRRAPICYSYEDIEYVQNELSKMGLSDKTPFVAIHPGTKRRYRDWGMENFFTLARRLRDKVELPVLLIGEVENTDTTPLRSISGLTIKQLAYLLENAALFVGNNSGPMHVAASMGTPCVIVQGPTAKNWEIFWEDVRHCTLTTDHLACLPCEGLQAVPGRCLNRESPNACMKRISVETVEDHVIRLLDQVSRQVKPRFPGLQECHS